MVLSFLPVFAEYTDDGALIPKNSSVIIRRIPIGGLKSTSKTFVIDRSEPSGSSKAVCKNTPFPCLITHIFKLLSSCLVLKSFRELSSCSSMLSLKPV
uniref:DWNN domain-containing protein n=1 Tax=Cyprinus carpio TaxID=7962 RepID=A0A8C2HFW5_CYPCA